jgi:beta-glucanase (GH16 family)
LGVLPVLVSVGCSAGSGSSQPDDPASSSSASAQSGTNGPWKQVWSDEFNGRAGGSIDTRNWKFDTGQGVFGTGEVETMTSALPNVHLDGSGTLDLVALRDNAAWTSARVETRSLFGAPAGGQMMVTASIRQPGPANALGYWPGFWMLGPGHWPMTGEIDIMEDVNGLSREAGTLHCGNLSEHNSDGTTGPCHEGTGRGSGLQPCAGCQQEFHTYTVIIDRRTAGNEQIRWYLDGREFFHIGESQVGQAVWAPAVDHGFSILLSQAVGGSYPSNQCRCTTPGSQTSSGGTLAVRYVRVYTS